MAEKADPKLSSGDESIGVRERAEMLANERPTGIVLGFYLLPRTLRHIVADYISDDKGDPTRCAFLGEQNITICFLQHPNLELGTSWHLGCLSSEDPWDPSVKIKVDRYFDIMDYQGCRFLLSDEKSLHYAIVAEVLVFQLAMSSQDLWSALNDLKHTLEMVEEHLNRVRHVVFAIGKHAFFCFSLKDVINNVTGVAQAFNRPLALSQILDDLLNCWEIDHTLSTTMLLEYYMLKDTKPQSDMYLSKIVISLGNRQNQYLFNVVDPLLESSKLKWLYYLKTIDQVKKIDQQTLSRCHAFLFQPEKYIDLDDLDEDLEHTFCFENSSFIERINVTTDQWNCHVKLPRPSALLPDSMAYSALIELTLEGNITLHLAEINTGYFPYLAHLSVIEGKMTGHLDSHRVPRLKTLKIDLGCHSFQKNSKTHALPRVHAQLLIDTGRPWQLVASSDQRGWSLASYDDPTSNPQDDRKEDDPPCRPMIRELLLVMETQQHADECQSRLNGNVSLKASSNTQKDGLLSWAPDRVEKITAFRKAGMTARLEFNKEIPGQTRILTSLVCHLVPIALHGAALPYLQSLTVNFSKVTLSGTFPRLKSLFFQVADFVSPWQLDAPSLQSLHCDILINGDRLSLRPELLPRLSFLKIEPWSVFNTCSPIILIDDENDMGLSRVHHVVFGKEMTILAFFDQCQVHHVLHLELTVNALHLPICWHNTVWQCETLTIRIFTHYRNRESTERNPAVLELPQLPRVKKLTVTKTDRRVLLNAEIPELTDCTVESPAMLGLNVKCPSLERIRFTAELSESDKEKCLNRAMYEAIGAHPKWVYFGDCEEGNIII